jgi:hypothetical protein
MPTQWLLILVRSVSVSRQLHAHSATQGFESLMQSIVKHVVEVAVDIIVPGAWLCPRTVLKLATSCAVQCV